MVRRLYAAAFGGMILISCASAPLPSTMAGEVPRFLPETTSVPVRATSVSLQQSKSGDLAQPQDSKYKPKPIGALTLDIGLPDLKPKQSKTIPEREPSPELGAYKTDPFASTELLWLHNPGGGWVDNRLQGPVSPFCYLPTYFEDRSLERFGCTHGCCAQPFCSTADFLVRVPLLPYLMTVEPPWRHRPPNYDPPPAGLGQKAKYYAGNISPEGVAVETAVIIGLFLLIP